MAVAKAAWITTGLITGVVIIILGILTFILTPKYNPPFPADSTISDILGTYLKWVLVSVHTENSYFC